MNNFITDFSIYLNRDEYAKTANVDIRYYHNNINEIASIENTENGIYCLYNIDGELFLIKDTHNNKYINVQYQFRNDELVKIEYDSKDHAMIKMEFEDSVLARKTINCYYKGVEYTKHIAYYDNGNPRLMYYECGYDKMKPRICHNNVPCKIKYYENGLVLKRYYIIATKDVKSIVKINNCGLSFKQLSNSVNRIRTKRSLMEISLRLLDSLINESISKNEYYIIKDIIDSKMLIYALNS